jgi:hypothetical protein
LKLATKITGRRFVACNRVYFESQEKVCELASKKTINFDFVLKASLRIAIEECRVRKMVLLSLDTKDEMQCISRFFKTTDLVSTSKVGDKDSGEL